MSFHATDLVVRAKPSSSSTDDVRQFVTLVATIGQSIKHRPGVCLTVRLSVGPVATAATPQDHRGSSDTLRRRGQRTFWPFCPMTDAPVNMAEIDSRYFGANELVDGFQWHRRRQRSNKLHCLTGGQQLDRQYCANQQTNTKYGAMQNVSFCCLSAQIGSSSIFSEY